ncbi:unnamed protein product [Aphanomyces euteiches]
MDKVLAVVGAGVVGLAVARQAARRGLQVVVLERNGGIGQECSGRNSEVIHAGIYYPTNSLKAKMCVRGKAMLYKFCRDYRVPHQQCGKVIVATSASQIETLQRIRAKAITNGVHDVEFMSKSQIAQMEPDVHCEGGLFSPSTGIVDSHALMLALQGDAEDHGASIAFHCAVEKGTFNPSSNQFELFSRSSDSSDDTMDVLPCDYVINCAGLGAPFFENSFQYPSKASPRVASPTVFAKGNYFRLESTSHKPFRHLVYPVPEAGGLGVHATIDMSGNVRFGPDVEWVSSINYEVDPAKAELFSSRIATYWPNVLNHTLIPDYSGIRPKVVGPQEADSDFLLLDHTHHGVPGLVHCCGIESPGLTSSLAIADEVVSRLVSS